MDDSGARQSSRPPLRAGGQALTLLTSSLNLEVLRNLAAGSLPLQELMRRLGFPPRSTARLHLRTLVELGAIVRTARSEFPTSVDYALSQGGQALVGVAERAQSWLDGSPAGPTELGSIAATSAVKALVEGWGGNIVRALATRPLSLTELDGLIPRISYPSLERRLTAMRQVGLLEARRSPGRASPYVVTDWLRRSVPPVMAAIAWERRYAPEMTPELRRLDVEAAFLLVIPLLDLDGGLSGKCHLAVEVHEGDAPIAAGVLVSIEEGAVISCPPSLANGAEAWVSGRPLAWLRRMNGSGEGELEVGGRSKLAEALIDALSSTARRPH